MPEQVFHLPGTAVTSSGLSAHIGSMKTMNPQPAAKWPTVKVPAYDLVPDEVVVDESGRRTVASVTRQSVGRRHYDFMVTWQEPGTPSTRFTSEDVLDVEHFREKKR